MNAKCKHWADVWKQPPNIFSVLVILLLAAVYFTPFGDLDFAILIRLGGLIVETRQLRPPESFSYTINGTDVPDFEWLFQIVVWAVWTVFGYGGLKLCKVLLVGATLGIVGLRLRSEGIRWHGIVLSLVLAVVILAAGWNLRPLYFTTIGLLLVSWQLHDHCTGKRQLSWWLPIVMLIWGNVHPGVITGQGLLLGAIVWEWLNRWIKLNSPLDLARCKRLTLIGGLGLAATFVSPAPIERLLCPFRPEVHHPIMRIFLEMRPLHETVLQPPFVYVLVYLLAGLTLLTVILRFRHYRLWEIALLAGTAGLAMTAVRGVQDWVLVMLSLAVPHCAILLSQWARTDRRRAWVAWLLRLDCRCKRMLQSPAFRFQWFWPAMAFAVLAIVSLFPPLGRNMPLRERGEDPVVAVNWLKEKVEQDREPWQIFANPDHSAFLVWRLGAKVRCYADTRGFCFPPDLIADGHYVPRLGPDWRKRLQRVLEKDTQYFFLSTNGPKGNLWQALREHNIQPMYEDDQVVVLSARELRKGLASMDAQIVKK